MPMDLNFKVDLDSIFVGGEWETTVGEIIKDELRAAIKAEVKRGLKNNPLLQKAVKAVQNEAAKKIIESMK